MKRFMSMDNIKNATVEELAETESMNQSAAESVFHYIHKTGAAQNDESN